MFVPPFCTPPLPPGPELDSDIAGEPSRHEIEDPPLAAEDLGVPRHLGLEEPGSVVNLGADQDRPRSSPPVFSGRCRAVPHIRWAP